MFPGVIMPVPPLKTPVKLAVPPAVIVAGEAAKLVIEGIAGAVGFIVTVAVWATVSPMEFVTVRIYIVVCVGVTLTAVPLATERFPGIITPVPPLKTPVRFTNPPAVIVAGLAAKLAITGMVRFSGVNEFRQPVRPVKDRMKTITHDAKTKYLFTLSPRPIEHKGIYVDMFRCLYNYIF
jgi:hypothetical protein